MNLTSSIESGPIIVRGDRFSGWGLYLEKGRPMLVYRGVDQPLDESTLTGDRLGAGPHSLQVDVRDTDQGVAAILVVDSKEVARTRLPRLAQARTDTFIGRASVAPMLDDENAMPRRFEGTITEVTVRR